jgi:hypothetical protein
MQIAAGQCHSGKYGNKIDQPLGKPLQ